MFASSHSLLRWWARGCCWPCSTGENFCAIRFGYSGLAFTRIRSPVLAVAGVMMGGAAALFYMGRERMPWATTLDALAPPLVVGLALRATWGALLAGAGLRN